MTGRRGAARPAWPLVVTWLALAGYAAAWTRLDRSSPLGSWGYFRTAARALVHGGAHGGLHVYHYHPQDQFGPVAMVFSVPFALLPKGIDKVALGIALTIIGLVCVQLIAAIGRGGRIVDPSPTDLLVVGVLLVPVWTELSINNGHLDDGLALLFGLAALHAVARRQPVWLALALAMAANAKPWAVAFGVLILALPARDRHRGGAVWMLGILTAWLPFFVADPDTVKALTFTIDVAPDSAIRALGNAAAMTPPWCRPAQLLVAVVVGWRLVRTGWWPMVLLATVAARIGLDPQTYRYYTTGAVLAALVADRAIGRRIPWLTLTALAALWLPQRPLRDDLAALLRADIRLAWSVSTLGILIALSMRNI